MSSSPLNDNLHTGLKAQLVRVSHASLLQPDRLATYLFGIVALTPLATWWRGSSLIWGADGSFPINLDEVGRYFQLGSSGYLAADARKLSFLFPWGVFLQAWHFIDLPWSAGAAQRILTVALLLISGLSMRALMSCWFPNIGKSGSTAAGLVYQVNVFCITTVWTSQSFLILHYSFLPLLLLISTKVLSKPTIRNCLLGSLGWTLMMSPAYITTPLIFVDWLLVGLVGIALINGGKCSTRTVLKGLAILFGGWLVLNLYWLIPEAMYYSNTFAAGVASLGSATSLEVFKLNSVPFGAALRLGGYWGLDSTINGSPFYPWIGWETGWIDALAYIPICLAVIGMFSLGLGQSRRWSRLEKSMASLLAILAALFLFAATGANAPLGSLKVAMFESLHLLDPFRSVYQRFVEYLTLAVAMLMGLGVDRLTFREVRNKWLQGFRAVGLVALIALAVVIVPLPFWAGSMFDSSGVLPSNRITVPKSYYTAATMLSSGADRSSVLTLPIGQSAATYLKWADGSAGFVGVQPLSFMTGTPTIDAAPTGSYLQSSLEQGMLSPTAFCDTLSQLNIQYVAWERDADQDLLNAVQGYLGVNRHETGRLLSRARCLEPIEMTADIEVYKNVKWTPNLLYFESKKQGGAILHANYSMNASDHISVKSPPAGFHYLVLNEPYDGNWRLNGKSPVGGINVTIFRIPNSKHDSLELGNVATDYLQLLLAMTLIFAAVIGLTTVPWKRRQVYVRWWKGR
jgi:hypothetical protein